MSPEDENERLAHAEYWNARYAQAAQGNEEQQLHEWFRSAEDLDDFFDGNLFKPWPATTQPRILHLGSGDSTVPQYLASKGYHNQLCVDFSEVVVKKMSKQHAELGLLGSSICWESMDVRHMDTLADESVDIAFDKGTLDAMIHGSPWSPPVDTVKNTSEYLSEISRILKPNGAFLYITYRQPHFIKPLLMCEGTNWDLEINHLGAEGSFGYYGIVCRSRAK